MPSYRQKFTENEHRMNVFHCLAKTSPLSVMLTLEFLFFSKCMLLEMDLMSAKKF